MPLPKPVVLVLVCLLPTWAQAFDFDTLSERARELAESGYQKPDVALPETLSSLDYDRYRSIRFDTRKSLWRDADRPFEVQFLHPGFNYRRAVKINVIDADDVKPLPFDPDLFDYGPNEIDREAVRDADPALGFSGFRVHFPLNDNDEKDEVLVFQGASYFRALGEAQGYGLSARGVALDTGEMSGEEFPEFTEFWIARPGKEDRHLVIYALMDSPRLTGAYRFELHPGPSTRMTVRAELHVRQEGGKLGLAPLTSMYLFGENQRAAQPDYRPEVHDSDGLSVHVDDEWLWRPLVNPKRLQISSFAAKQLHGFGLMQRDRDFHRYEDLEARFERRPSAWVAPRGDWGAGRVELVMIPTPDETNDNIVAYWVPDMSPESGQPLRLEYDLRWQMRAETQPPLARVVQTRTGHGWQQSKDDTQRYHIDFEGDALDALPDDTSLRADVWAGERGTVVEQQLYRNEVTDGWRLSLRIRNEAPDRPLELRATLKHDDEAVSETWAYLVLPTDAGRWFDPG
ncbi:glucan biosynthesis protein [Polycyclovorans algicola]|uniref:glucan biosynthesis protein n=1 Tax=Polycyclovorans algicola TaxID=616992 RepID=UPI0004A7232F|nr:glucan biosynthesis protein G [Polycyclovorans algicola]